MPRRPTTHPDPNKAELSTLLCYLGLNRTAGSYADLIGQAQKSNWSHLKFLEVIAGQEAAEKKERSVAARIGQARFPVLKTIDTFDFAFPKSIPRDAIMAALSLEFLDRSEGFIFLGDPGTGKTHLAIALGYAACLKGARTRFINAVEMVNDLQGAAATHQLKKAMLAYVQPKLLIIDEVGYLPFDRKSANLFFQVISARYERGATILTTNQPFKNWGEVFGDTTAASAIIDRLAHHNEVIRIIGDSYRVKDRKSRTK
jgi:DNA replication protein DnaC